MRRIFKQHYAFHWINNESGAAAIVTVIIILVVAMLIVSTTAFIGVDDLEIGHTSQIGGHTLRSAESCVEEALLRLSRDSSYSGGTLDVGDASCNIVVTGTPCGTCSITTEAVQATLTRTIEVGVTISGGTIDITSWEEQ